MLRPSRIRLQPCLRYPARTAQPIRRAGLPEDVARAALWLASDESSFVNGHALVVDGGVIGGRLWSEMQQRGQMARAALVSQARLAEDASDAFYRTKIVTARFYADHVLSQAPGLSYAVVNGAPGALELSEDQF